MAAKVGKPPVGDIESGTGNAQISHPEGSDGSDCFSDAEEESWHSAYHSRRTVSSFEDLRLSNASSSSDRHVAAEPRRDSICSSEIDLEEGGGADSESKLAKADKDCRICHLGLASGAQESGIAIELGCSCKEDLAAAHQQCAETWFKIKGNRICEVCGAVAKNVIGAGENEGVEQWNDGGDGATSPPSPPDPRRSFWHGHRLLNFLLACMVLALFISWLFHFNVPG